LNTINQGVTGRRARSGAVSAEVKPFDAQSPPVVYTISDFCHHHHISVALYYKMRKSGDCPREMVVGRRRLISAESAAEWRRARERDR
jgi:hypothetical protein